MKNNTFIFLKFSYFVLKNDNFHWVYCLQCELYISYKHVYLCFSIDNIYFDYLFCYNFEIRTNVSPDFFSSIHLLIKSIILHFILSFHTLIRNNIVRFQQPIIFYQTICQTIIISMTFGLKFSQYRASSFQLRTTSHIIYNVFIKRFLSGWTNYVWVKNIFL